MTKVLSQVARAEREGEVSKYKEDREEEEEDTDDEVEQEGKQQSGPYQKAPSTYTGSEIGNETMASTSNSK